MSIQSEGLIGLLTICFLILISSLSPLWLPGIGAFLVVSDPLRKSDALVILSGDENERISFGAELFHQGYAEWFILTDMRLDKPDSQAAYSRVVKRKAVAAGVAENRILIPPGIVATTYEEAVELRSFAESRGFHSLIIVTSPYHSRRARWILHQVFDASGINLIVQPVQAKESYRPEEWWKSPAGRKHTFFEYVKLLAHFAGCRRLKCAPYGYRW